MNFKICDDIGECKALWNQFSPNERLFDIWDYRMCFFDKREEELHFIVGCDKDEIEGFIPLVFVKRQNQYIYLGGWLTAERNFFYIKDKTKLKDFLEQCPDNTFIEGIDPVEGKFFNFSEDQCTHHLDLSRYNYSFEAYLGSLGKKRRKNLRFDLKNLPEYRVYCNRIRDLDRLVDLNIKRYDDESKFHDKTIKMGMHRLVRLALRKGSLDMISVEINDRVEAVDVCAFFKGTYYALIGSSNNQKIPNLGKLMTTLDIKNAMKKKAKCVEFGATADHWKNMWEFEKDMLLKFEK